MRIPFNRTRRAVLFSTIICLLFPISAAAQTPVDGGRKKSKHPTTMATVPGERAISKKAVIDAPLAEVWHAWTTPEGIMAFWGVESNIKLEIGGPYEIYMGMTEPDESGTRGSEGCRLLSYVPMEMVAFEWSFPPAVPTLRNAHARTFVVLRFEAVGDDRTRVRLYQLGWKEGDDWDKGYRYFDRAWSYVLDLLKQKADALAKSEQKAEPKLKKRIDGDVTVRATLSPQKRQDFEVEMPASVPVVWNALATADGMKRVLGIEKAEVELQPGGKYAMWPGAPNKVTAYVPHDMLSTSGSAPEQFPNVRKGGTWSAYFLEPAGKDKTRLRLVTLGWRNGEKEWDEAYDYFLKNNAQFLNQLKRRLAALEMRQ